MEDDDAPSALGAGAPTSTAAVHDDLAARLQRLSPKQLAVLARHLRDSSLERASGGDADGRGAPSPNRPAPGAFLAPITRVDRNGDVPLSFGQERLWFLDQLEPNSAAYNMPGAVRLRGALKCACLVASLAEVVQRHEVLRTTYEPVQGMPRQRIHPSFELDSPFVDFSGLDSSSHERILAACTAREARRPFDLARGPVVRAHLVRLGLQEHVLLFTMHHIASDAWSIGVLVQEVALLYSARASGHASPLPEPPIQYADYAHWQRRWLSGAIVERQLAYWRQQLNGAPPALDLPTDGPRQRVRGDRGARVRFEVRADVTARLADLGRRESATLFMVLLTSWKVLLARYSGERDVVVGSPIATRARAEAEGLIGFFVNTLALRTDVDPRCSFRDLISRVKRTCVGAYANQDVPFERLVDELSPDRDLSRTPLFQVMLALQNATPSELSLPGLTLSAVDLEITVPKFDLTLEVVERDGKLEGSVEYDQDLFAVDTVGRIVEQWRLLVETMSSDPTMRIAGSQSLPDSERQMLEHWGRTSVEHPKGTSINELFHSQAVYTADAVALVFESQHLTYGDLAARVREEAARLRAAGATSESIVGVYMDRSLEMPAALLAILAAGAAYLPLDPTYPAERLSYMLRDASADTVVAHPSTEIPSWLSGDTEVLRIGNSTGGCGEVTAREHRTDESNLAYVIYTSGSSGVPKGVQVTHDAVINHAHWMQRAYGLCRSDRILQLTPISFDVSVGEILGTLLAGACLVLCSPGENQDAARLVELLARDAITSVATVPGMLRVMLEEAKLRQCVGLRRLLCGSEAMPGDLLRVFDRAGARYGIQAKLYNAYGPTETAIDATWTICDRECALGVAPIGRPIDNKSVHIVDDGLARVPIGAAGELLVGGIGEARGYHRRADLTADRFIPNPFGLIGARLYRTADVARYLRDGQLAFLGRRDAQVKVRGFRVELGEIESALLRHPEVREAAALVEASGHKRLVGAVVIRGTVRPSHAELRAFLSARLPEYLVPSAFVVIDALPRTPSGKLDRRAIPAADAAQEGTFVPPRDAVEQSLAGIWSEVLRLPRIGAHSNFFELGGHSLLATQMVSRIRQALEVELPLRTVFESTTLAALADEVRTRHRASAVEQVAPIARVDRRGDLLLSFGQERLWFLDQLEPNSTSYSMPGGMRLRGRLQAECLAASLTEVVRRHDVLRTTYAAVGGVPRQRVHDASALPLPFVDVGGIDASWQEVAVRQCAVREARRPFDLARGPVVRARVVRIAEREHAVFFTMHHIASDGWSVDVLLQEVAALYAAFALGRPSPLPELPVQYADYAQWQRDRLGGGGVLDAQLMYWRRQLDGIPRALELPCDRPRPPVRTDLGGHVEFELDAGRTARLEELGRQEGATLFMTLLAGWQVLLSRYSGQRDIVVGSPIANRTRADTEGLIGFFVNTIALRTEVNSRQSFRSIVARVKETCLGAYAHQDLPFDRLIEELAPERDLTRAPLFQVMFALQNAPRVALTLPDLELSPLVLDSGAAKFDLTLTLEEHGGTLRGDIGYAADLFDASTIGRMAEHLTRLLQTATERPEASVVALPLLSDGERAQLLVEWNHTAFDAGRFEPLIETFEALVKRLPDAPAVVFGDATLSYAGLNLSAERLAVQLANLDVGPEVRVGVCAERSIELVVALVALLKAGGTYLPLDPDYPMDRLASMIEDAGCAVVLTQARHASLVPGSREVVLLDAESSDSAGRACRPTRRCSPEATAYVLFTSGSTGRPKGTAVPHRAIANHMRWMVDTFGLDSTDATVQKTPIGFDASVWEFYAPLMTGGRLVVAEPGAHRDPERLAASVAEHRITVLQLVPSMLRASLEGSRRAAWETLERVFCGGEALSADLVERFHEAATAELVNLYGPTEACIDTVYHRCDRDARHSSVPIGRPIHNTRAYVLDEELHAAPVGVHGELWLAGECLAHGYVGQPLLSAERFWPDALGAQAGGLLYRTGDRVRWTAAGDLEFSGRIDDQVKLRGLRIELGEIGAVLRAQRGIRDAVVLMREDAPGEQRLVAYVVGDVPPANELRSALRRRLPEYMVPAHVVELEALPLMPNGKVDRKALPSADARRPLSFVAPRDGLESLLAEIWSDVLQVADVGVHDDFFELGGHSLLATQVVSRIRQAFGTELPLRAAFEATTVAALADQIRTRAGTLDQMPPIPRVDRRENLPLSFGQQRLWFLDQLEPNSSAYNIPGAVRLKGRLQAECLIASLAEVVRRHEVLRTTYEPLEGAPCQRIHAGAELELRFVDLSGVESSSREVAIRQCAAREAGRPFDLARGPVVRGQVLRNADEDHALLFTMHHIASDGWSIAVLIQEVALLYGAYAAGRPSPLPELPVQYGDYAQWQRSWLTGDMLERQVQYWQQQLDGIPAALELPTDQPRPRVKSDRGGHVGFEIDAALTGSLEDLSRREGITLFMALLAAWQVLLARYSGQRDIVVGSPIANRTRAEVEGLIGFFVNTLALRTHVDGPCSFREILGRVKDTCIGAYMHQHVPFERVVEALAPDRDLSRTPVFQVMLVLQNAPRGELSLPGLTLGLMDPDIRTSNFDLSLSVSPLDVRLWCSLEFDAELFDPGTMDRLAAAYSRTLCAMVEDPAQRVDRFSILDAEDASNQMAMFAGPPEDSGCDARLHALFARQVALAPTAVALEFEAWQLTYAELDHQANRLAEKLRAVRASADDIVALCVQSPPELIIGVLGVLQSGCAFLPIDAATPAERIDWIVRSASPVAVVTEQKFASGFASSPVCITVEEAHGAAGHAPRVVPTEHLDADNMAYVMYTSGSTGAPKGVMVSHRSIHNRIAWGLAALPLGPRARHLQLAAPTFDTFLLEVFLPLGCGGVVLPVRRAVGFDVGEAVDRIVASQATALEVVPSVLEALLEDERLERAQLQRVVAGGEALSPHLRDSAIAKLRCEVFNSYGPTETTVDVTHHRCSVTDATVPLGRPNPNVRTYVLDSSMQPGPIGAAGQMVIGGVQLARGYHDRPDWTVERFLPDPFGEVGARVYCSGDIVRVDLAGNLRFLGRSDHQVKVRGVRIELGEVENRFRDNPTVRDAVVVARESSTKVATLVAYVVRRPSAASSADDLRDWIGARLPQYMVPSAIVELDELPLTSTGKVDRKALPAPPAASGGAFVAASGPVEEPIARIWSEVLGVPRVGIHDDFFALGGNSLLATQAVSRIRRTFGIELPLRSAFEASTVAALAGQVAARLQRRAAESAPPITRAPGGADLRLSFGQERLWFLDQLQPGSAAYNVPGGVFLRGPLRVEFLMASLTEVVRRHEVLRTTYASIEGEPRQSVREGCDLGLTLVDLSALEAPLRDVFARHCAVREAQRPFDLARGPVLRGQLLRMAEEDHALLFTMHHIASDGWSTGVLVEEVTALYGAYANGRSSPLPELPIQYADYAHWQRGWLTGQVLERELAYWRGQLQGASVLELPTDRPRPRVKGDRGAYVGFELDAELSGRLRELGLADGGTLFMVLLAAWQVLLARYSGQRDIVVGSPIANRAPAETEPLIGFFVNTLALRTDVDGTRSFRQLLARVKETCLGAYAHQQVPFERVVDELSPQRDLSRTPLFQVMMVLQNAPIEQLRVGAMEVEAVQLDSATAKFDLTLSLAEAADGRLVCTCEYATELFRVETVERMAEHWRALVQSIVASPDRALSGLTFLLRSEQHRLLFANNDTATRYPGHCVHELFEMQAQDTADAIAVADDDAQMTYKTLLTRAWGLALELAARGVGPEQVVGVCVPRSTELAVALLAVLRAGAAYLPVDARYPRDRLAYVLRDAGARWILTTRAQASALPAAESVLCVDAPPEDPPSRRSASTVQLESTSLAYVIYTSGSTGLPKGVMVTHGGLVNYLTYAAATYQVASARGAIVHSSMAFDLTVTSMFTPLLVGGRVRFVIEDDIAALQRASVLEEASLLKITPAHLDVLAELTPQRGACGSPTAMIIGGEMLHPRTVEHWRSYAPESRLINEYGPTETVVGCAIYDATEGPLTYCSVPIGRPIANTQLYVLDEWCAPAPASVPGELYVSGDGVSRGYRGAPALTSDRFVPDVHRGIAGQRMYRTGDRVRYLPDDNLEYLGRNDHQVKLRGFRIELGEVEFALGQRREVREVAVVPREDRPGDRRLVAYVVLRAGYETTATELRQDASRRLPDYMVPSAFVTLDRLPLTQNGKLDRTRLPVPEASNADAFVAARDPIEARLVEIWAELLRVPRVGVFDGFFELGGHSLLAAQLISRVRQTFGIELPLHGLFEAPTVAQLAERVRAAKDADSSVPTHRRECVVPLRPEGKAAPLFLVHAIGGEVACYLELARQLPRDVPIHAIQAVDAAGPQSLDQLAARYVDAIKGVCAHGPYRLGGWSFGGLVAFQMARHLESQRDTVDLVAVIDADADPRPSAELDEVAAYAWLLADMARLAGLGSDLLGEALASGPGGAIEQMVEAAHRAGLIPRSFDAAALRAPARRLQANMLASTTFTPGRYGGKIVSLRAERSRGHERVGWGEFAANVETHVIDADHYGIVRSPAVLQVARILSRHLLPG